MRLFGSGIFFYGGPGESHHKYFVKSPGDLTQRRVSEFAKQVANRVYESMSFEIANEGVKKEKERWTLDGETTKNHTDEEDDYHCSGSYSLFIMPLNDDGSTGHHRVSWNSHNKQKSTLSEHDLHPRLLKIWSREVTRRKVDLCRVKGYTEAKLNFGNDQCIFRAHPWYR